MDLFLVLYFCRIHQLIIHYVFGTFSISQLAVVLFFIMCSAEIQTMYFKVKQFNSKTLMQCNTKYVAVKSKSKVIVMNKSSAPKTNLLSATLVVWLFSLDSLRSNVFVIQLNHRPELNYYVSEYPSSKMKK